MSPRRLDADVVGAKLRAITRALDVLTDAGPVNGDTLAQDPLTAAAVERLLSRIVDLAVDVNAHVSVARLQEAPPDYRSSFALAARAGALPVELATRLAPSTGLRNAIVHTYLDLDLQRLAAAVPFALTDYRTYVTVVAGWMLEQDVPPT